MLCTPRERQVKETYENGALLLCLVNMDREIFCLSAEGVKLAVRFSIRNWQLNVAVIDVNFAFACLQMLLPLLMFKF